MTPRTNARLVLMLFLCGLEETVLSQHGHCTENQCFALFNESKSVDFPGAQKDCKDSGGQLVVSRSEDAEKLFKGLPSGFSGSYWLGETKEEAAGLKNCSSISVSKGRDITVQWKPCHEQLDGFLCQYTLEGPCRGLPAGAGAQVEYTAYTGYEVIDSEKFPPGTVAVVGKAAGKYADSKHICFSGDWMRGPWSCDVLQGGCEQGCYKQGDTSACTCGIGYSLARDNRSCELVKQCPGEHEELMNTDGDLNCVCKHGFKMENGVCVNVSICMKCEHMMCENVTGVYECLCQKGYRVSAKDPTKCERHCTEEECPPMCDRNTEGKNKGQMQCFCPDGYILDEDKKICFIINECDFLGCEHTCENGHDGYRCSCNKGFMLHEGHLCLPTEVVTNGSVSTPVHPTPASVHPAGVPSYVKTGSVLGIAVFMLLCTVLLFFVVHSTAKRCGRFELTSLKHPDIDIFYLQQVTTETYKRLSFDKQSKNDPQIL